MTTRFRLILTSLALSAAITTVHAESAPGKPAPARITSPLFAALDSDHNGTLSGREIAAAPLALAALDSNHDGVISPDEWQVKNIEGRTERSAHGGTSFNLVFALDANHDGNIQAMEVANAVSSLRQLDLNADGELTRAELRPIVVARN